MQKRDKLIIFIVLLLGIMLFIPQFFLLASEDVDSSSPVDIIDMLASKESHPICRVDTGPQKLVALTFDDGPDPRFTNQILDILLKYQVRACFFVIGKNAEQYPELITREIREGHEVENHTFNHPFLSQSGMVETETEIRRTGEIIKQLTHKEPHYFRPPRNLFTQDTLDIAAKNGYQTVLWSICVEHRASKTPHDMAQRVIQASDPGMIILAHDGNLDRSKTVEALPIIIEAYQQGGYTFVRLDELLAAKGKQ